MAPGSRTFDLWPLPNKGGLDTEVVQMLKHGARLDHLAGVAHGRFDHTPLLGSRNEPKLPKALYN